MRWVAFLVAVSLASTAAAQTLDRFNGFESGGTGDYSAFGSPTGTMVERPNAAGRFALETTAAAGNSEYVSVSLSQPAAVLTDSIWLCVNAAPTTGRRIRTWLNGGSSVLALILRNDGRLELNAGQTVGISDIPVASCPSFSHVTVEYVAMATATMTVDGNVKADSIVFETRTIDSTRIGPDDSGASVSIFWDDHAITRSTNFPENLRIAGLLARQPSNGSDPQFRNDWEPSGDCPDAVSCVDEQPPDGDDTYVSTVSQPASQSFCIQPTSTAAVFGTILAAKSLVVAKATSSPTEVRLSLRFNASACGGGMTDATSSQVAVSLSTAYAGGSRIDTTDGLGQAWTSTILNNTEMVVTYQSGFEARLTQVLREVAFDTTGFPSPTPTTTPTPTPTTTPTITPTVTPTFSPTVTPTETPTRTPTPSDTPTPSITPTLTLTFTPSRTFTATHTFTATPTSTVTPTPTMTPTATQTFTPSLTPVLRGLVQINGFEGGTGGDYSTFPTGFNAFVAAPGRTGDFSLEAAHTNAADYVIAQLAQASAVISDGIWACQLGTIGAFPRRIRGWLNASSGTVVGLFLSPDGRIILRVGTTDYGFTATPMVGCAAGFTHYELRYKNLAAGGTAELRVNGQTELAASHTSTDLIVRTRIGPDDSSPAPPALRWDDHTFAPTDVWPGDLGIVALRPNADGFYTQWSINNTQLCGPGRFECVMERPPDQSRQVTSSTAGSRVSFCYEDAPTRGVNGPILGVKSLINLRQDNNPPTTGGLFIRTGGCRSASGVNQVPEVPFDAGTAFTNFARVDQTSPATGAAWAPSDIHNAEFGVTHSASPQAMRLAQSILEVVYDRNPPTPIPPPSPTSTPTFTPTRTPTVTPTSTPLPPTATLTSTPLPPTSTFTPTRTPTVSPTGTFTQTPTASNTPTVTTTPTITPTSSESLTPTPTATEMGTPTETPSETPTSTPSPTATPTGPTPTPFPPRQDYIFVMGGNEWECTQEKAIDLGFSTASFPFDLLEDDDPQLRQLQFLTVYVAPGLTFDDYDDLRRLSADGGFIERFVFFGGVAVIHVQGEGQDESGLAPRGVRFRRTANHNMAGILDPTHPYITGLGYDGALLDGLSFINWNPTDEGVLVDFPDDATVLLENVDGASLIEYEHGQGRVIVSALTFCTQMLLNSQGEGLDNLLKFSRFFNGLAQTPGLTFTPTSTPTPTPTGGTPTRTATRTPTETPTATETPLPPTATATELPTSTATETATPLLLCGGDCNADERVTVNEIVMSVGIAVAGYDIEQCRIADIDGSGEVTVDELVVIIDNAMGLCGVGG